MPTLVPHPPAALARLSPPVPSSFEVPRFAFDAGEDASGLFTPAQGMPNIPAKPTEHAMGVTLDDGAVGMRVGSSVQSMKGLGAEAPFEAAAATETTPRLAPQELDVIIPVLGPGDRLDVGPNTRQIPIENYRPIEELANDPRPQSPHYPPSAHHEIQTRRRDAAIANSKAVSTRAATAEARQELKKLAMNVATTGVGAFVSQVIMNLFSSEAPVSGTVDPIQTAIANSLVTNLSDSASKIVQLLLRNEVSRHQSAMSAYLAHRQMTTDAVARRSPDVREAIARLDDTVDELIRTKRNKQGEEVSASTFEKYLEARVLLLSLPYRQHITPGSLAAHTGEERAAFNQRLDAFVETYPEADRERLRTYIQSIAVGRAQPALLHGPGGTGKTHFARGLAEFLGVPIVAVNVKDGLTKIYPPVGHIYGLRPTDEAPDIKDTGALTPHLASQGINNFVLLLDEASLDFDECQYLKQIIQDGSLQKINLSNLKVKVPLDKLRIVLTTNHEPADEALLSRMTVFHMNTVNPQTKVNLAAETIAKAAQEDIDELALTVDDANTSRQLAHAAIRMIVGYDRSPGVRESQNTAKQVYTFISTRVKNGVTPSEAQIEAFIQKVTADAEASRLRAIAQRASGNSWGRHYI